MFVYSPSQLPILIPNSCSSLHPKATILRCLMSLRLFNLFITSFACFLIKYVELFGVQKSFLFLTTAYFLKEKRKNGYQSMMDSKSRWGFQLQRDQEQLVFFSFWQDKSSGPSPSVTVALRPGWLVTAWKAPGRCSSLIRADPAHWARGLMSPSSATGQALLAGRRKRLLRATYRLMEPRNF